MCEKGQRLAHTVEKDLFQLIWLEVSLAHNAEMMKQDLVMQFDFRIKKLDCLVDDAAIGFIDLTSLKRFMKKVGVHANN